VGGNVPSSGGEKGPVVQEARQTGAVQSGTTSPYYGAETAENTPSKK
jgi:hypothetical protein